MCDRCHSLGANDLIEQFCTHTNQTDPLAVAVTLMKNPAVKMHGADEKVGQIKRARERAEHNLAILSAASFLKQNLNTTLMMDESIQKIYGEWQNNAKLKKVPPKSSPSLGENDGKFISTWNFGYPFLPITRNTRR